MNTFQKCEICGATDLVPVLDLGKHPLCDDLIPIGSDGVCKQYPIEILYCKHCYSAHQKYQVQKEVLFPTDYHYRSRFTKDVLNGMQDLVKACKEKFGDLTGKTVLDIGCNDGSLLGYFREYGCVTVGVEPTDACDYAEQSGHRVYKTYFTKDVAEKIKVDVGKVDFIVFTNVFAHIEDLPALLAAVQELVSENTVLVIENHYLGEIIERYQFDTFYHEHPRTYSLKSFEVIADTLGMQLYDVEFPQRYGGNIRVFISNKNLPPMATDKDKIIAEESQYFDKFADMRNFIGKWKKEKCAEIDGYVNTYGKLRAKAFPGRAAILIQLLDIDNDVISAVYEKPGSMKIGYYVPGTRIEIHSDDELFAFENKSLPILNLAWHISGEIKEYLAQNGYAGDVVNIL